jgi:hypothetical protein
VTNLIRSGADVVMVAEIAGHRRLDTTRRYSLPSQADKDAALEAVVVETDSEGLSERGQRRPTGRGTAAPVELAGWDRSQ